MVKQDLEVFDNRGLAIGGKRYSDRTSYVRDLHAKMILAEESYNQEHPKEEKTPDWRNGNVIQAEF